MKKILLPIAGAGIALLALTIFRFLPVLIGNMLGAISIGLLVFVTLFLARGPPMAFINSRLGGGTVLGVVRKDRSVKFGDVEPEAGMLKTENHGAFNIMPQSVYSAGGIPFCIAPEMTGYNIGIEQGQLAQRMKEKGIEDISDIADVDKYGRVKNFKDCPEVRELKEEGMLRPWTTSFDDFYKYTKEASNPIHQDANIKMGIEQGLLGQFKEKYGWIIAVGMTVFLACLGVFVLLSFFGGGDGGSAETVKVVTENASRVIRP